MSGRPKCGETIRLTELIEGVESIAETREKAAAQKKTTLLIVAAVAVALCLILRANAKNGDPAYEICSIPMLLAAGAAGTAFRNCSKTQQGTDGLRALAENAKKEPEPD